MMTKKMASTAAISEHVEPPRPMVEPQADCGLCPRLVEYRSGNQRAFPEWFNGAVPSWGPSDASILIVGLAPGVKGANRTGRPFTGDYAGDLLYETLCRFGLAKGQYGKTSEDGLELQNTMITNAVRCVPPQNKPVGAEIRNCGQFLKNRIAGLPDLKVMLALGLVAHNAVLTVLDVRKKDYPFSHNARHVFADGLVLYDSYHCSRYNTNTKRLTWEMFREVISRLAAEGKEA